MHKKVIAINSTNNIRVSFLIIVLTNEGDMGPAHALIDNNGSLGLIWEVGIPFESAGDLLTSGDQGWPITGCVELSRERINGT